MKTKICNESLEANEKLPPKQPDRSGIGVYYVDAYLKPMNVTLEDGTKVACKRRGLKVTLTVGDKQGFGLLRRLDLGPDLEQMLRAALEEAAETIEVKLAFNDGIIFLER